jgi:hypothetical protein
MMKNKIITILLLAGAGFGQDAQAMGRAGKFAKEVFRSKTAAVAGVVMLGVGAKSQFDEYQGRSALYKMQSSLPVHIQSEVQRHFSSLGIPAIEMIDVPFARSLGVYQWFGTTILVIPRDERLALQGRMNDTGFTKEEVLAIMEHEASHLRHRDSLKDRIFEMYVPGTVIMAGEAIRVAGASKKIAAGSAVVMGTAAFLAEKWRSRQIEKRADCEVSPENAGHFASALKKALPTVEVQSIAIFNAARMKQGKPLYGELDSEEKKKIDSIIQGAVLIEAFTAEHPPVEERIAYSNERAVKFRKEKAIKIVEELRELGKEALTALDKDSFDKAAEKFTLKVSYMQQLKKSMIEDECREWEKEYGEEIRDLSLEVLLMHLRKK